MLIEKQNKNLFYITTCLKDILGINDSNVVQKVLTELMDIKNWKYFNEIIQKIENLEQEQQKLEFEINSLKINKSFLMTPQQEEKWKLNLKEKEKKLKINKDKIDKSFLQLRQKLNTIWNKENELQKLKNKLEKVTEEKENIKFKNEVVWNKEKYYKLKIIINRIHTYKVNNQIKDTTYNEINKDHLNLYIKNLQDDIEALKKKKINPVINFLLKIFSCGLYSKNKYLTKNINTKNKELNYFLLISKKLEKDKINQPENPILLAETVNSIDLQNQPTTSCVRPILPTTMH